MNVSQYCPNIMIYVDLTFTKNMMNYTSYHLPNFLGLIQLYIRRLMTKLTTHMTPNAWNAYCTRSKSTGIPQTGHTPWDIYTYCIWCTCRPQRHSFYSHLLASFNTTVCAFFCNHFGSIPDLLCYYV